MHPSYLTRAAISGRKTIRDRAKHLILEALERRNSVLDRLLEFLPRQMMNGGRENIDLLHDLLMDRDCTHR